MIKTWISSYSPTQEKFENLYFVAIDYRIHELWVRHVEAIVRDRSFFTDFISICSEEK